jgi:hypothetical protein
MCLIPFALWISNAAARFSGIRGAVSIQARRVGCSRQAIASMPPRQRHGRLGPMGKTGISITASSISSHSLTAVLVRLTTGNCSPATHHSPLPPLAALLSPQALAAGRKMGSFFLLDPAFIRSKSQCAND